MSDLRVKLPAPCPESWDAMAPAGCNRHCASCDKIIHDLEQMTIGDVEALIAVSEDVCVRARIDGSGKVALKSNGWRGARRMMATIGAGVGLMVSGSAVMAKSKSPNGTIVGEIKWGLGSTRVTATDANGKTYRVKSKPNGKYKIKNLPPGTYALTFNPNCGPEWDVEKIVVEANLASVINTENPDGCIIVGRLVIESDTSQS